MRQRAQLWLHPNRNLLPKEEHTQYIAIRMARDFFGIIDQMAQFGDLIGTRAVDRRHPLNLLQLKGVGVIVCENRI